jgi:hypothetical protein
VLVAAIIPKIASCWLSTCVSFFAPAAGITSEGPVRDRAIRLVRTPLVRDVRRAATLRSGRTADHEQCTRPGTQSVIAWMIA